MLGRISSALAFLFHANGANPMFDIDMYRAMTDGQVDANTEENDDMADLIGVLKYIHTEALAESIIGTVDRQTRKYSIDVIVQWRFKVKNTDALLTAPQKASFMDFGNFAAFDSGQATQGSPIWDTVMQYGDYVGVQPYYPGGTGNATGDARYPTLTPYYWMSISGFCPNLTWTCTAGYPGCSSHTSTNICTVDNPCPAKGTRDKPHDWCLKYTRDEKPALGGLCRNSEGKQDETIEPTGEYGCVYNYMTSTQKTVKLDDLAGITSEDCHDKSGVRKCKDWLDFRQFCTNVSYKRKFSGGAVTPFQYCVEYDILPACANDCNSPECKAAGDTIELGLPFWQGRCDRNRNQDRHEQLAAMFEIDGAQDNHQLTASDIISNPAPCGGRGGGCEPLSDEGGPYCTRQYSGICTPCYIPNTKVAGPNAKDHPICPKDVTEYQEYTTKRPNCKTVNSSVQLYKASDLCCLWTGDCIDFDKLKDKTDEDGLAYAWYQGSTQGYIDFFSKILGAKYGLPYVHEPDKVKQVLYNKWFPGMAPSITTADVDDLTEQLKPHFSKDSLAPTVAPTPPPSPGPAPPSGGGSSFPVVPVVIVLAVVIVGALGGGFIYYKKKQQREAELLLMGDGMSMSGPA